METEQLGYGGVRYALRPKESKDVKKVIRRHGGLTHDEIRKLAAHLHVATKPIQNALNELRQPILTRRSKPIEIASLPTYLRGALQEAAEERIAAPVKKAAAPKVVEPTDELAALRRENEKLKAEIIEHRRIRAQADRDMLRARQALAETAERRRRHQEEQAALADPRKQVEELTDTLRICRQVLLSLCGRYAEIVKRLPLPQLEELIKRANAELKRRKAGGRRQRLP